MMKPLSERSLDELKSAKRHLEKIEGQVAKDSREVPGSGWAAVVDMLNRDRSELEEELSRRQE